MIDEANIPQIKYFAVEEKMTLGRKRNYMHEKSSGSYIVYMDDDDYYPPERIEHAVDKLQKNRNALCAGSSELYIYYTKWVLIFFFHNGTVIKNILLKLE